MSQNRDMMRKGTQPATSAGEDDDIMIVWERPRRQDPWKIPGPKDERGRPLSLYPKLDPTWLPKYGFKPQHIHTLFDKAGAQVAMQISRWEDVAALEVPAPCMNKVRKHHMNFYHEQYKSLTVYGPKTKEQARWEEYWDTIWPGAEDGTKRPGIWLP